MKELIQVRLNDLAVDFNMDLNNGFVADYNTRKFNAMFGAAEPEVINVFGRVLKKGDTAIDGGANVGYHSLIMASLVGLEGKVLAFEPGPDNAEKLRRNVALNRAKQVKVIEQPLWGSQKVVKLHMAADSGMHALHPHNTFGVVDIESTTIDAWHESPKLIKLDVEGSEIEALIGAMETVAACKPFIVCEMCEDTLRYFGKGNHDLRSYVKRTFGYDTWALLKKHFYPLLVPEGVEVVTTIMNLNVMFATVDMVGKYFDRVDYE